MSLQAPLSDVSLDQLHTTIAKLERRIEEDRMIFDQLPIMFWYKDDHNVHLRVNRSAAALEGLPITAIEGAAAEDLYPPEQAERFLREDLAVIRSGQPKLGFVEQHVSPMGKTIWLKTGKVPTHDDQGSPNGVIAFALDVTEEYELREKLSAALHDLATLVEAGADKSELLSVVNAALALLNGK